jgi:hypothetical protein
MRQSSGRVPWVTHLVAAVVTGSLMLANVLQDYGLERGGPWGLADELGWLAALMALVLTGGVVAALIEVLLLRFVQWRWPARLFAVAFVVVSTGVAAFPMTFRLFGDRSPIPLTHVTSYVVGLALLVVGQLTLTMVFERFLRRAPAAPAHGET